MLPARVGLGAATLLIPVIVGGLTTVVAVEESFPVSESPPAVVTEAVLEITVEDGVAGSTVTSMTIMPLAPGASTAAVQDTVPLVPAAGVVQVKPGAETETNRVSAGSTSVIVTPVATLGPDRLYAIEYDMVLPAKIVAGAVFVTPASETIDVVTVAVALLFSVSSSTSPEIVAVFAIDVPVATSASTATTRVIVSA